MKLPSIPKLANIHAESPRVLTSAGTLPDPIQTLEEQYHDFPPPFNSSYEWYIWLYIKEQHLGWEVQQTFGGTRQRGSTRVDFLNRQLSIAFFPDGTYWHTGSRVEARDTLNRAQLRGYGWRVVQWLVSDFDQVVRDLPEFYRRMVFG